MFPGRYRQLSIPAGLHISLFHLFARDFHNQKLCLHGRRVVILFIQFLFDPVQFFLQKSGEPFFIGLLINPLFQTISQCDKRFSGFPRLLDDLLFVEF